MSVQHHSSSTASAPQVLTRAVLCCSCAVCILPPHATKQDFLRSGCDLEVSLKDLRLLLPTLSADAAAIAGQAVALSQWHQVRLRCLLRLPATAAEATLAAAAHDRV